MAGDWIKLRVDLATDPAVIRVSEALGVTEFEVVGMLHHFWSWADAQSRDGHADGVTKKWVDRYVHCEGFAEMLEHVGWLKEEDWGISIPNFDRHNGASAKARGLAKDRQKNRRDNLSRESSRCESDEGVTREEKRREEKEPPNPLPGELDLDGEQPKDDSIPYDQIFDVYSEVLPGKPAVRIRDEARRKAIRSIWRKDPRFQSVDFWRRYFQTVKASQFLMGSKTFAFDWLMKPANFKKVAEGNYS